MANIDPMIEEALRRTNQMQGSGNFKSQRRNPQAIEPEKNTDKNVLPQQPPKVKEEGALDFLLKDKEQSLIMLLVVLLMSEDSDPTLLLTLMYLLI